MERNLRRSSIWFTGLMTMAIVAPQILMMHWVTVPNPTQSATTLTPLLYVFLFTGGGSVAAAWLQSWRYMEMEFVRPIPRRVLLKDLGIAIAIQTAQAWAIMAIVIIGVCAFEYGVHSPATVVAEMIGIAFANQCVGLAVALLVMPLRSPVGVILAQVAASLPAMGLVVLYVVYPSTTPWIAVGAGVVLMLIAGALLPIAIRRWDATDLG